MLTKNIFHTLIDSEKYSNYISKPGSSAFAELDKAYIQVLSIYPDTDLLLRVLGVLLTPFPSSPSFEPYELENVECPQAVPGLHPGQVEHILRGLHSVLELRLNAKLHPTSQAIPCLVSSISF